MTEKLKTIEELKESDFLIEGEDYGKIQGIPKPCLLQPGAQKIAKYYGWAPTFVIEQATENHEEQFYFYRVRCLLTDQNGETVGDMVASFSTLDSRKKGTTQANTIVKMAEKRAFVSAVLYVAAGSGVFSADVDDMPPEALLQSGEDGIKWFPCKWSNGYCAACGNKHCEQGDLVGKVDGKWMAKKCYEHLQSVDGAGTPEDKSQDDKFRETLEQMDRGQLDEQAYSLADTTHNRIAVDSLEKMGDKEIIDLIMEMRK